MICRGDFSIDIDVLVTPSAAARREDNPNFLPHVLLIALRINASAVSL